MAGTIKGITIEISGNTKKLQNSLKDVNTQSKSLAGELRSVEKLLKFDPGNTELLAQKQKLLGESIGSVSTKLATLKEAQKQVDAQFANGEVSEEQYRALQREIASTEGYLKKLESQLDGTNKKWGDFGKKAKEVGASTTELGKKLVPVSLAATGVGVAITKMASDFTDSMAKVSTIADTTKVPIKSLEKQILDLSNQTGISANAVAEDVYNAISAGQDTADAVNFVAHSTKLAKAGFAESAQTLDILTTTLNAYGLEASEVGRVSDILVQTQNKGKVTVAELSANMGKLIPTAKASSVQLDQLGAGYAIMTSKGIAAAEATTYMNGMLNELSKSGSITDKVLRKEMGKSFTQLSAEGMSVADILAIVSKSAIDSGKTMGDMFGSSEAAKAGLILLGDSASTFNDMVLEMNNSVGATNVAFEKMQTPGEKMAISLNALKNVGIELGIVLIPVMTQIATWVSTVADKFSGLDETTKLIIIGVIAFAAALAPLLMIIGHVITAVGVISTAIGAMTAAFGVASTGAGALGAVLTVLTGPIGLAVAAVAALAIGGTILYNHLKEDAIPAVKLFGDETSAGTQKAVQGYLDLDTKAAESLMSLKLNSGIVSAETSAALVSNFDAMGTQIKAGMDLHYGESYKTMQDFFVNSSVLTLEEETKALEKMTAMNETKKQAVDNGEKQISDILLAASEAKRALTSDEQVKINEIQEKMKVNAVKSLSETDLESMAILERMKAQAGNITALQAAEVAKNSIEQKNKAIENANAQYNETVKAIIKQRDETGSITAEQADKLIADAVRQKNGAITSAEEMNNKVVEQAKKQAADHVGQVDWETGEIKSKWEIFKEDTSRIFNELWDNISKSVTESWGKLSAGFVQLQLNIKNWFSGLANDAYDWGKNMIDGFIKGITDMIGKVRTAASKVTNAVSGYLGFNSPAKEGEGRHITEWGTNMIGGFLDGVKNAIPNVASVVGGVTKTAGQALTSNTTTTNNTGGSLVINMYNPQVADKASVDKVSRQLQQQIYNSNMALGVQNG